MVKDICFTARGVLQIGTLSYQFGMNRQNETDLRSIKRVFSISREEYWNYIKIQNQIIIFEPNLLICRFTCCSYEKSFGYSLS